MYHAYRGLAPFIGIISECWNLVCESGKWVHPRNMLTGDLLKSERFYLPSYRSFDRSEKVKVQRRQRYRRRQRLLPSRLARSQ